MTEKTIIDNVDVSGCRFYLANLCLSGHAIDSKCINLPNCYYKQLKRKEQECNRYKQVLEEIKEIADMDSFYGGNPYMRLKTILQKCEVLENE